MTATTWQPSVIFRRTIERYILQLFEADGITLKSKDTWPGVYTLPNGAQIPAVFLVGKEDVPADWKIQGIETTITEVPKTSGTPAIGGALATEEWQVMFNNYGNLEATQMATSLQDILRRLVRAFPADRFDYTARSELMLERIVGRIKGHFFNPSIP